MSRRISYLIVLTICVGCLLSMRTPLPAASEQFRGKIFSTGEMPPVDSRTELKPGDKAPDFTLPSISGESVSLSRFLGTKNVVISFVPAAWTPVCSDQWPGYNVVKSMFDERDTVMLGITVDNIPTLYAWTEEMGGYGSRCCRISGLTALWPANTAYCVRTALPKGPCLSSISRE